MPDFMVFLNWKEFPWHWAVSTRSLRRCCWWRWCGLDRVRVRLFRLRSRIKGVYFSIITQALTYAAMLLFSATRPASAATTLHRLQAHPRPADRHAGHAHDTLRHHRLTLIGCFVFARWLVNTKYGRVLQASATPKAVSCSRYNPWPTS